MGMASTRRHEISEGTMTRFELYEFLNEHMCLCGQPDKALQRLLDLLRHFEKQEPVETKRLPFDHPDAVAFRAAKEAALTAWLPDEGAQHLLFYWIDHLHLIEHGGSVGASWLTKEGETLLKMLAAEEHDWAAFNELSTCGFCGGDGTEDGKTCACCNGSGLATHKAVNEEAQRRKSKGRN
jgi:hypothetical protein